MKKRYLLLLGFAAYWAVCTLAFAETSLKLDVSLGSMVGAVEQPESGQVPFWGELYVEQSLCDFAAIDVGVGHRSNADRNGTEMDGEYYFGGVNVSYAMFYGRAKLGKFFRGDIAERNTLSSFELGVTQDNFRFGAFLERTNSEDDTRYSVQGLKFGYVFDLL